MAPSRRALLRAVSLGIVSSVAGCTGDRRSDTGTIRETTTGRTTRETTGSTTGETTAVDYGRTIEFAHRSPALDRGVDDLGTWYCTRVFANEREADELDASSARNVAGRDPAAIRRFVADTDFEESALVAIQAAVESPRYGLAFDFVDEAASPPQIVGRLDRRDREDGEPATSTLLVRVAADFAANPLVTLVDRHAVRSETVLGAETFEPPNERAYATVNVEDESPPHGNLSVPGGALVTTPAAAERFLPDDARFAEFVRATDFDRSYLLAVQLQMGGNAYHLWPTDVRADGPEVSIELRRGFGGPLNAEFANLTLGRIPGAAPERGTATVREYDGHGEFAGTREVSLSDDPGDWSDPTTVPGNRS